MELFDEVQKHFPAIHKHALYLFKKVPPEKRHGKWKLPIAAQMVEWIWDELLDERTILYQTFLRAGVLYKLDMSMSVFEWYLMDRQLKQNKISPAGTSPVRE